MFWKSLFSKRFSDKQLDAELRFHIDEVTEANIAAGMTPEEARRRALIEFGGPLQMREELRDVHRVAILDHTIANAKAAFRFMRKSPSFSLTVILTLALGIGANSAVFSAIDAILLRPLPYPDGDRLMRLTQSSYTKGGQWGFVAPVRLQDWNRMASTFAAITGYYTQNESETTGAVPEKLTRALVAPRFLQVMGVSPILGRDFTPDEERFGGPDAVLISERYWRIRFGADPNIVGKRLRLSGYSNTIVGVMAASFLFPDRDVDLWSSVPMDAPYAQSRESTWFTAIGRLRPGVTTAQAKADMSTVQSRLGRAFPKPDADLLVTVQPLKEITVGGVRRSLWVLYGSVSLLLLVACTNIAALLLSRAATRQHEVAIRFSLGASRASVVLQLLTEALALSLAGAALGLAVANGAAQAFRMLAKDLPRLEEIHLDGSLVLYTLASAVAVTLLCALFPALQATRHGLSGSLAHSGRTQVSGRNPLHFVLVGVQVALAVALLTGAGLLLRSFQALGQVAPGFDASHVLTLRISAGYGETADMKRLKQRIDGTIDGLRAVPGVADAAVSTGLPGVPDEYGPDLKLTEGGADPSRAIVAESRFVSPGYFSTLRIPLLAGEICRDSGGPLGVVVNRSFAAAYLAGLPVVGRHLQIPSNSFVPPAEIRGIVGDARENGLNAAPGPTVYWCFGGGDPDPHFLIRTYSEPMALAHALRRKVREISPSRSVFDLMPLEQHLSDAFAENRMRTILLSFFAITAVLLASIGLYGTLSYFVNLRRRETGLRLALGALRGQILRRFLLQGLGISALGCIAGVALAVAFTRVLAGMLYGVSRSDPATWSGVVLVTIAVALVASLVPAVRAARVEPMQVLREE